jgi:hypothetical protein
MRKKILRRGLFTILVFVSSDLGSAKQSHLSICDLVASPEKYAGKEATIRGTYRVAFEASQLYCLSCLESGKVWAEFDDSDAGSKAAAAIKNRVHSLGTVNGTFSGILQGGGRYGHMGDYGFQFTIREATHLDIVDRAGLPPESMARNSLQRVCH